MMGLIDALGSESGKNGDLVPDDSKSFLSLTAEFFPFVQPLSFYSAMFQPSLM